MGRFETTATTYARYREPYPSVFFAAVAERLGLRGFEALIDLGTGPGVLALGFRPYVGSILGVDPEPGMLSEARAAADAAGAALPLIAGRAEDLASDIGPFDLVTIGRALHWMDRPATLAVLERILAADGAILICGSRAVRDARNPWQQTFDEVIHGWGPQEAELRRSAQPDWFAGTPFVSGGEVETEFTQPVTPQWLFERALTRSSTSPAVLGERIETCRAELIAALAPFFPEGPREETLKARAEIWRRQ